MTTLPPPSHPDKDFLASLRVVNGTLECPPQQGPQPYQDLPGGYRSTYKTPSSHRGSSGAAP